MRWFSYQIGMLAMIGILLMGPAWAFQQTDTYREAYDSGYTSGVEAGKFDRFDNRPYDFANRSEYQSALRGFNQWRHDREVYSVAFRRGFEDGYEVGYGLSSGSRSGEGQDHGGASPLPETYDPSSGQYKIPAGTEIHVRLTNTLSTQRNERGDRVEAETTEELAIGDDIVIPADSKVRGIITELKRPGRIRGRAEMDLRFTEIELPTGELINIHALISSLEERADESVKKGEGTVEAPGTKGEDTKKVGIASGVGALIGVLAGGGRGGAIGAAVGAAAGVSGVLVSRGQHIILPSETEMVIRLERNAVWKSGLLRR